MQNTEVFFKLIFATKLLKQNMEIISSKISYVKKKYMLQNVWLESKKS